LIYFHIGIIAAIPEELQTLLDAMTDATVVTRAGRAFWVGDLFGCPVVAVLSRIGKVAAAITTTVLISEFRVGQVIFTGVAGGLGVGVRVGDVVVASSLLQHDMDASPLFPRFELPGLGVSCLQPPADLTDRFYAAASKALVSEALSNLGLQQLGITHQPTVHLGLIISGDQFINSTAAVAALRDALPDALAVEMEGAAVAQVCHDFDVPYAVIRTISDRADDAAHVDFPRFIEAVARHYSLAIVREVLLAMAYEAELDRLRKEIQIGVDSGEGIPAEQVFSELKARYA
jgi:adenosylhomocysteine nucleosidase